jgi:hypothetical protein
MTYILLIVVLIIAYLIFKGKSQTQKITDDEELERKKNDAYFNQLIEKEPNPKAKEYLTKIKSFFDNGDIGEYPEILTKLGVPQDVAYSKSSDKMKAYLSFENEMSEHLFETYGYEIGTRNRIINGNIPTIDDAFDRYKIVLKDNEILIERFNNIYMFQEKTIRTNVSYSGMRWSNGPFKMGNLSYTSKDVKDLVVEDIGRLFLTNKRLIFVGKQNKISEDFTLSSIVDYYLYKDGLMICRNNRKNIIFRESQNKNYDQSKDDFAFILNDFSFQIISLIRRIVNEQ